MVKCPKCNHIFELDLVLSDQTLDIWNPITDALRRFPNRDIPPYPYNAMGDIMTTLYECKECDKLLWTTCNWDLVVGLCSKCIKEERK